MKKKKYERMRKSWEQGLENPDGPKSGSVTGGFEMWDMRDHDTPTHGGLSMVRVVNPEKAPWVDQT